MVFCLRLITALILFASAFSFGALADNDAGNCERLKEISSVDPDKKILLYYKTREQRCSRLYFLEMKPLPLSKILSKPEQAIYKRATANEDCSTAAEILSEQFVKTHPRAPSILENKENYTNWKIYTVFNHYPAMSLCNDLEDVKSAQAEMDRLGLTAPPYAGLVKSMMSKAAKELPWAIQHRHTAIARLHRHLGNTMRSAIALALLKLSVEGTALKYHPVYELYIALRLRARGQSDLIMKEVIERPHDAQLRTKIELQAQSGGYKGFPIYPE